jgi:Ca2+-binding RTX toxin-like protein
LTPRAAVVVAALVLGGACGTGSAAAQAMPRGGKDDVVKGTAGADVLRGGRGDDRLVGRQGSDRLSGGPGRDRLEAGPGRDTMRGGAGGDTLIPGVDDRIDRIIGGRGDDLGAAIRTDQVSMGSGQDYVLVARPRPAMVIDCGPGQDTVSFQGPPPPGLVVEGCEEVVVL